MIFFKHRFKNSTQPSILTPKHSMRASSRYRLKHFKSFLLIVHKHHRRAIRLDTSSSGSTLTHCYKIFSVRDACSTRKHANPETPRDLLTSSTSVHCIRPTDRPESDQIHCTSSNCAGVRCFSVCVSGIQAAVTDASVLGENATKYTRDGCGPTESTPKLLTKSLGMRR